MSRQYPRFLFSDPQNSKSKGPFIIHLLKPRLVFKVTSDEEEFDKFTDGLGFFQGKKKFFIILLDPPAKTEDEQIEYDNVIKDLNEWLYFQIKDGHIPIK